MFSLQRILRLNGLRRCASFLLFVLALYIALVDVFGKWGSGFINDTTHSIGILSVKQPDGIVVPAGHPWHRWSAPEIDTDLMVHMLETAEGSAACLTQADKRDSKQCKQQHQIVPLIIRNGTVYHSLIQSKFIMRVRKKEWTRIRAFEETLQMALDIARKSYHQDKRLAKIALSEFPLFVKRGDPTRCISKPILTWATQVDNVNCRDSWPVPSYHLWQSSLNNTQEWNLRFQEYMTTFPWEKKRPMAVWRGAPNGPTHSSWEDLPRVRLVQQGMIHPDLIDAAMVGMRPRWKDLKPETVNATIFADPIEERDFMKYMAIIDIDGNSWSSRFGHLLCYNSVVLKVQPHDVDYFQKELKPWKHYIPVYANLSNMVEMVEYAVAEANRDEMKKMVQTANDWCSKKLVRAQLAMDLMWTLVSYVELLHNDSKGFLETWRESRNAYDLPALQMEPVPLL